MSKVDIYSHLPGKEINYHTQGYPKDLYTLHTYLIRYKKNETQLQADPRAVCIQYVDEILVGHETYEGCLRKTEDVLKELHKIGIKVSKDKLVVGEKNVVYLGRKISKGKKGFG